jgi:hypothetical protein
MRAVGWYVATGFSVDSRAWSGWMWTWWRVVVGVGAKGNSQWGGGGAGVGTMVSGFGEYNKSGARRKVWKEFWKGLKPGGKVGASGRLPSMICGLMTESNGAMI